VLNQLNPVENPTFPSCDMAPAVFPEATETPRVGSASGACLAPLSQGCGGGLEPREETRLGGVLKGWENKDLSHEGKQAATMNFTAINCWDFTYMAHGYRDAVGAMEPLEKHIPMQVKLNCSPKDGVSTGKWFSNSKLFYLDNP